MKRKGLAISIVAILVPGPICNIIWATSETKEYAIQESSKLTPSLILANEVAERSTIRRHFPG